jgi:hypothetical protein
VITFRTADYGAQQDMALKPEQKLRFMQTSGRALARNLKNVRPS